MPSITPISDTARVSIAERLVPCLSFGLAALSAVAGGAMIYVFFEALRRAETVGRETVFAGFAKIQLVVGSILTAALLLGVVGIAVAVARMFAAKKKASPPGPVFIVLGLLGLIPSLLIAYALSIGSDVITKGVGAEGTSQTVTILVFAAVVLSVIAIAAFLAFSFVPFSSSLGRKYSPTIFLILIELATGCVAAMFFWAAVGSSSHTANPLW